MKYDEIGEKVGRAVRENVAHIIFGAVVLLMVFLSFVTVRAEKGTFNWFNFLINLALQLSIFVPYRWRQKSLSGKAKPYINNKTEYSKAVKAIHAHNRLKLFADFCEIKTQELRRQKQLDIVHAAGIDTSTWDSGAFDGLSPKQIKAVERAKRVKVKAVNPFCITSNSNRIHGYGLEFNDNAEDVRDVIAKILPMFLWAGILTFIVLDALASGGLEAAVMIVFRLVMCLSAMFSGTMSGNGFVIRKDKVILCRIDFIRLFDEWLVANGVAVEKAEIEKEKALPENDTARFE